MGPWCRAGMGKVGVQTQRVVQSTDLQPAAADSLPAGSMIILMALLGGRC